MIKVILTTLNAKFIHSSLALRYLKAYYDKREDKIATIDIKEFTINEPPSHISGELYKEKAEVVAFSCYIWNLEESLVVAEILKKVSPKTVIIFGGPEVSYDPTAFLQAHSFIDIVAYGEGEQTFEELIEKLQGTSFEGLPNLEKVKGICYRVNSSIKANEPRPLITNLDEIPSVYQGELAFLQHKMAYLETSRGCPFQCQYCLSSTIKGVRNFSLERVKKDLQSLIKAGVQQVKLVDRTFNCDSHRALEIFQLIRREAVGLSDINFHFEIAADLLKDEVIDFLAEVPQGLFQFEIGVQSTNPKTLEIISRKMNFQKVKKVINRLKSGDNIHLHLDLIAGLPAEDWDSFRNSFNDVYLLNPHKLQLGFLKLLKGSGLRERFDQYGYVYVDKPPYEVLASRELNYPQILELKNIEELVEKYHNSYKFNYSLNYFIKHYFSSPFDFYLEFAKFWEARGYFKANHNQVSLFQFMGEFFQRMDQKRYDLFKEILKLDYLLQGGIWTLPDYFKPADNSDLSEEEQKGKDTLFQLLKNPNFMEEYLPDLKGLYMKQAGKFLKVQVFTYDVLELLESDKNRDLRAEVTAVVFNYHNRDRIFQRAEIFRLGGFNA